MAIAVIAAVLYASFCFLCLSFGSLYFVAAIQTAIIAMKIIDVKYFKETVHRIVDISMLLYTSAFESEWL